MFSGGDSSGEGVNVNFQLSSQSSAACAINTPTIVNGSIDWASLAQQWIQMRDFSGVDIVDAPTPPNAGANFSNVANDEKKTTFEEHGVADMEMDDDEDNERKDHYTDTSNVSLKPPGEHQPTIQSKWFPQQSSVPAFSNTPIMPPTPASSQWNAWPQGIILSPVLNIDAVNPTAHIPSLMKINISDPNVKSQHQNSMENVSTMDAAKKKVLPAWIREGLEKMEREKQKQLGKQDNKKEFIDADVKSEERKDSLPLSSGYMVNNKNVDILESGSSGNEEDAVNQSVPPAAARTSKDVQISENNDENCPEKSGKNYEQKLSDLMIIVRKTLTELLLEVTNEEIFSISQDVVKSYKIKATSAQVIPKSDISTITGKLGLAAYDDSSDDTSESETEKMVKKEGSTDSEEDIKMIIRAKRKSFIKTSEEIEERIAECALREEQKLKYYSLRERLQGEEWKKIQKQRELENHHDTAYRKYFVDSKSSNFKNSDRETDTSSLTSGKGYERDFGETSESKLQISNNGKRQKERTTRFSDNKDTRLTSTVTNTGYIPQIKCNQVDTAVQKINSTLLKVATDDCSSYQSVVARPVVEKAYTRELNSAIDKTNQKNKRKFRQSSDDNDSSSHSSESSETSNRTAISSKHSYPSKRSRSTRTNERNRKSIRSAGSNRHYDHRSSRHKYQSSDSDHSGEDDHHNRRNRYSRHSARPQKYSSERNKSSRTRSRSRSLSKSRSKYSSSRHRH